MKPNTPISGPEDDDWRLQTTARLSEDWANPWTGNTILKGARLTVSSVVQLTKKKKLTIPVPNATALLLNASAKAFSAARLIRESNSIDTSLHVDVSFKSDQEAFDYVERIIEAVILAFTAVEAFVNESIPENFVYVRHARSDVILEPTSKQNIERHVPIDEKLTSVLPEILKCASPKGSRCWQGYKQLKATRDRLTHIKTEDRKSSGVEGNTVWQAIILTPAPHLAAKAIIDHFVKTMDIKPNWHSKFPRQ